MMRRNYFHLLVILPVTGKIVIIMGCKKVIIDYVKEAIQLEIDG